MTTSPAAAFHATQEAALRGSAWLKSAMSLATARIYTVVPANATMPYVVLGEDQVFSFDNGCGSEGEIFATVNWWSKPSPPDSGSQARAMGAAIIGVLDTALALVGHTVDVHEVDDETYVTDPDGSTHGRAVFHYLTTEVVTESET